MLLHKYVHRFISQHDKYGYPEGEAHGILLIRWNCQEVSHHLSVSVPSKESSKGHVDRAGESKGNRMEESEKVFRSILDHMLEGCQVIGSDWRYLYLNDVAAEHGHRTKEELPGHTMMEMYPGIEKTEMFSVLRKCMEGRAPQRMENEFTYQDGSKGWFELRIEPVPEGIFILSLDVTNRRQVEEERARAITLLNCSLESTPDGVFLIDKQGRFIYANSAFLRWTGLKEREVIGKTIQEVVPLIVTPENAKVIQERAIRRLKTGEPIIGAEIEILDRVNNPTPIAYSAAGIKDERGNIIGEVVFLRDTTERKQAEERVNHLNLVLKSIRNVNQLITMETDRGRLLKGACDNLVENRGYHNAWAVLFNENGKPEFVAEAGMDEAFSSLLEKLKRGELPRCARGAMAKDGVFTIDDINTECVDCPLAKRYRDSGAMSSRLEHGGKFYGLLTVSIPINLIADKEERTLFREVANDIAFALSNIRVEEGRKRAVERLRESEEKYCSIVERANDGIVIAQDNIIKYSNPSFAAMLGYGLKEIEGIEFVKLVPPENMTLLVERYKKRLAQEKVPAIYESTLLHRSGRRVPIEINANVIQYMGKMADLVIIRNLTERKKLEEELGKYHEHLEESVKERTSELEQAKREYETILRTAMDCFWITDMQGRFLEVNDAYCRLVGYTRDELLSMLISDIEAVEKPEETIKHIEKLLEQGYDRFETGHRCKDGRIIDFEVSANYLDISDGRLFVFLRDITERKKAENMLRQEEERFRVVFDESPIGKSLTMPNGRLSRVNRAFAEMLGLSVEAMSTLNFAEITYPEDMAISKESIRCLLAGEQDVFRFQKRYFHKDGHLVWTSVTTRLLRDSKREPLFFMTNIEDITERKKAEEKLKQLNEALVQRTVQTRNRKQRARGVQLLSLPRPARAP